MAYKSQALSRAVKRRLSGANLLELDCVVGRSPAVPRGAGAEVPNFGALGTEKGEHGSRQVCEPTSESLQLPPIRRTNHLRAS
jgi:hypothetical protein